MGIGQQSFGVFGSNLDSLRTSEFFQWFSLEPDTAGDGTAHFFRPAGPAFHDLVQLQVLTGGSDDIRELRLHLARSFVDDPRNGAFALDITKSFLHAALGATPLVEALENGLARKADIFMADAGLPERPVLSKDEENLLETYAGSSNLGELRIGERTLRFENRPERGRLVISVTCQT